MPWTPEDSKKHTGKADTPKKSKQWSDIANSVREKCMKDGGDEKTCSAKAVMQANGVIAKLSESENSNFNYLMELKDSDINSLEDATTITIDVFREGAWLHPKHGKIEGNQTLFNDFISNWKNNVLGRDLLFDKCHNPEDGSTGIVKDLFIDGNKLKAKLELTNFGKDLIQNKGFRYFSPEYTSQYTNKENGSVIKNVLIGGALTNRPFLTNLAPVVLSEDIEKDFKLSFGNVSNSIQPTMEVPTLADPYDLICSFVTIIRQLSLSGDLPIVDLKNFVLKYIDRVDFSTMNSMSEELKTELNTLLEEYFS